MSGVRSSGVLKSIQQSVWVCRWGTSRQSWPFADIVCDTLSFPRGFPAKSHVSGHILFRVPQKQQRSREVSTEAGFAKAAVARWVQARVPLAKVENRTCIRHYHTFATNFSFILHFLSSAVLFDIIDLEYISWRILWSTELQSYACGIKGELNSWVFLLLAKFWCTLN